MGPSNHLARSTLPRTDSDCSRKNATEILQRINDLNDEVLKVNYSSSLVAQDLCQPRTWYKWNQQAFFNNKMSKQKESNFSISHNKLSAVCIRHEQWLLLGWHTKNLHLNIHSDFRRGLLISFPGSSRELHACSFWISSTWNDIISICGKHTKNSPKQRRGNET